VLDNRLRAYKDVLLRPLADCTGTVSPNTITVMAAIVGVAAAGAAALSLTGWALGLWLANRVMDGLDGMVARRCSRQSDFGGYLDIVLDFLVYAAIPIGLYLGTPTAGNALGVMLLLATFYVNGASWMMLAAILEKRQAGARFRADLTTIVMPPALVGGTETILFYCVFLIWPHHQAWLYCAMAAAVLVGVGQRLWWAYHHLANDPSDQPPTPQAG
jgi:phosphatidylglycerophosphate synthase